jgi:hypothetical protein
MPDDPHDHSLPGWLFAPFDELLSCEGQRCLTRAFSDQKAAAGRRCERWLVSGANGNIYKGVEKRLRRAICSSLRTGGTNSLQVYQLYLGRRKRSKLARLYGNGATACAILGQKLGSNRGFGNGFRWKAIWHKEIGEKSRGA